MDVCVSEGDADRLLEEVEEGYFPPKFKEYMLKEPHKCSRFKPVNWTSSSNSGWVFWSQHDREIKPSPFLSEVRNDIRDALKKLICSQKLFGCLVQFWAPTTTLEGRIWLTTRYQPFALGMQYLRMPRQGLCEYRMEMCGKEQFGLPGRVFLYQFPESSPGVEFYSTEEYPQRDLALRCKIIGSWAVPVFKHSTCVGVLEMVSLVNRSAVWHDERFLHQMCDIFQEFRLQCFDGCKIVVECREKIQRNGGFTPVVEGLYRMLSSVCKMHELPLAIIWVPCRDCNGLLQGPLWSKDVFYFTDEGETCYLTGRTGAKIESPFFDFLKIGKCGLLREGWVARRSLSPPDMLYFRDITKLSVDEYPLVPYARMCKFSGLFIISLHSSNNRDDVYVLEFFSSASSKDNENIEDILERLNEILETMRMEDRFENFRFSSGLKLGYESSVEVFDVQDDQKISKVHVVQATKPFSTDSGPSSEPSSASVSNLRPG